MVNDDAVMRVVDDVDHFYFTKSPIRSDGDPHIAFALSWSIEEYVVKSGEDIASRYLRMPL